MNGRLLAAAPAGVLVGGAVIAGLEAVSHQVLSGDAVFVGAALALGVAGAIGAGLAVLIGRTRIAGWIVVAALFALSLVNVFSFPHPVWFTPAAAVALLAAGWVATRLAPVGAMKP